MSDEKRYLEELGRKLDEYVSKVQLLPSGNDYEKLRELLNEILTVEKELRESCEIGTRFNVIRTQLEILLDKFEKEVTAVSSVLKEIQKVDRKLKEDEILIYVYLFNSQGGVVKTWQRLLSQDALMEHSVNRPIYINKDEILKVLEYKTDKLQHSYLEVAIRKYDIVKPTSGPIKDQNGFDLLKIRQSSLKVENIYSFFHNGKVYPVVDGEIIE